MRRILFFFLVILPLLAGCGGRTALSPTPFPTAGPTITPPGQGPIVLTVTELMAAPGLYRDTVVQLTGLLRKQPLIVCDTDMHPSPAGWGLAEEGVLALAGGFEDQVRSLLPDNLTMSVEGRWRRWEGVVGCGKLAQQQEVWFLEVDRILSPSPITQVTVTPSSGIEIAAITATPFQTTTEAGGPFTPELAETPILPESTEPGGGDPIATDDPFLGGEISTPTLSVSQTPDVNLIPSATLPAGPTPTTAASITGTPGAESTGTPAGTPTPTLTGTPPTQTPTATGGASGQVVDKGNLFDEMNYDFIFANLASGTIHQWEFDLVEDEIMFVNVIAPQPADVILSVKKDGQTLINRQNTAGAGSAEMLNSPSLTGEGTYQILVEVDGGIATDYAITGYTDFDTPILFAGTMTSGNPRSAVQMPAETYHYWIFVANAGDNLTLRLKPLGSEDPAMYLYGPDGEEIETMDEGYEGDEELLEVPLTASGLYAVGIEEVYGDSLSYDLELTLE